MYRILAACVVAALGGAAMAQDLPSDQRATSIGGLRALGTADAAASWTAVGRLDTGASFCSATLIAPDLVLTAAHCLYHPTTHVRFAPGDLTFSAGLRNGRAEAVRSVRRMLELPGYVADAGADLEMISVDLALLELQHPIAAASIVPIPTGRMGPGTEPVTVVSYGQDREASASIEEGCEVLARSGSVRTLSCEVASGASGSPVLRVVDGRVEMVAVMSARGQVEGGQVSLAVVLDAHLATLLDQHERLGVFRTTVAPVFTGPVAGGATIITPGEDGRARIGARFVRP